MVNLSCASGNTSFRPWAVHPAATSPSSTGGLRSQLPVSPLRTIADVRPQAGSALVMGARLVAGVTTTDGYESTEFDPGTTGWRAPV